MNTTRQQSNRANHEHLGKGYGARNVDDGLQTELEKDGGSSIRQLSWIELTLV